MGVQVYIQLLDRGAYARLADAHRGWQQARDGDAVLAVLRDALERVRTLAPRPSRAQRREELGRRLDALPEPSGAELEKERASFERSIEEGSRRLATARASGDPAAIAQASIALSRNVFTGILAPLKHDPERAALVEELFALGVDPPGPALEDAERLEQAIASLSSPTAPGEREEAVSWTTWTLLVRTYATAWDREPRARVEVDLLLPFGDSTVLDDLVGFARGEPLELYESLRLFTPEQVIAFRDELARLPPDAARHDRVVRVRRLVDLAASDPRLALGSWSG
jgi:hypothetical protein